ncbi:MAG: beta strand repeat-containing protein [Pyrinomonadaceae bacterium]
MLPGSPAIDAGTNCVLTANGCGDGNPAITTDQRGVTRPLDGNDDATATVDIGAFELQNYVVNSTADDNDTCDPLTSTTNCSLREAINAANASAGGSMITFAIPAVPDPGCDDGTGVCTITPTSALPNITKPVAIDGYSQTSATANTLAVGNDAALKIELNGTSAGAGTRGLWLAGGSDGSNVRGLVINRFDADGIYITSSNNVIAGNFIGTDVLGANDFGNTLDGIFIEDGASNTIGGTAPAARNLISGNGQYGIQVFYYAALNNLIQGNYIGTNASGTAAVGNSNYAVFLFLSSNGTVGGTAAGAGNVISGNNGNAIQSHADGNGNGGANNTIQGNLIGVNAAGNAPLGNSGTGINLSGVDNNVVGGSTAAARNIISNNSVWGVRIEGFHASGNVIQGNSIGTDAAGTATWGNGYAGVYVFRDSNNTIGGAGAGEGNIIANNGTALGPITRGGVIIEYSALNGGNGYNNAIRRNSIFNNNGLGINLLGGTEDANGVTANDVGDGDPGANQLQNFPVITSAPVAGTTASGTLDSYASGTFTIDIYLNASCDASGYGEGQTHLGSEVALEGSPGQYTFSVTVPTVSSGQILTATATDANGNTSEFSQCFNTNTPPTINATNGTRQQGSAASNPQIAIVNDTESGPNGVAVTVNDGASATVNGVTVSNIVNANDGSGNITANIIADCTATDASFTLTASDGAGGTATDTLTITVTANTPPVLTYASPQTVVEGNSLTVTPATGPSDNGSINSIVVQSSGGAYTGNISVDNVTGVVSISNAAPAGSHIITISATDNCVTATDAQFTLNVTAPVCTTPPSGMLAWYPGDGNANDIQGPTFENGTLQGGATFATGKVNQAFSFGGGSNDGVLTSLTLNYSNGATLDAWIKTSDSEAGAVVSDGGGSSGNNGMGLFVESGQVKLYGSNGAGLNFVVTGTNVADSNWHHIAGTWTGTTAPNDVKLYVDGVEVATGTAVATVGDGMVPFSIGGDPAPPSVDFNNFNGLIDEVEIFNTAVSAPDIVAIYNASFAGKCRTCTTPPTGMVSWWPSEGNANDIAGPNNGTFAASTYAAGKVGQAFSFDGVDDQVSVPHNANQNTGSQITIDAWVNPTSSGSGRPILQKRSAGNVGGYTFETGATGELYFVIWIGGTPTGHDLVTPANVTVNGVWQHVAATYDGATMKIYVNGVEKASRSSSGAIDAVTDPIVIGRNVVSPFQAWHGGIDEIELFNRALSQPEIAALTNAGYRGKCHTSAVTVGVDPASVTEDGAGNLVYTFRRSGDITTAVTVNFTVGGTATFGNNPGDDYTQTGATTFNLPAGQGTIEFLANEGTKTVTIHPTPDTTVEPDETVVLTVTSGTGYEVGSPAAATGTISNDDATLTLVKTVINNNGGNKVFSDFPLFIDGNPVTSGTPITVSANAVHTATETTQTGYAPSAWGTDCNANGTITLQPGDNKTCTITNDDVAPTLTLVKTVVNDSGGSKVVSDFPLFINGNGVTSGTPNTLTANVLYTASETTQTGYAPSVWGGDCNANGTITLQPGDSKTCTITNDDVVPTISIDNVPHPEGDTGTVDYDFTVSLSYSSTQTITVNYATANDTAVAPGDYTAVTTTQLTFNPGETSKPVKVVANTDTVYELDEDFVVNLSSPVNATIGDGEGRGTITNDDLRPNLSIGNVIKFEGTTPGTVSFDFTVTKSGNATDVNATVNYATAPGTASENPAPDCTAGDYQFKTGSLTFTPLEFTKTITILVCKDSTFEADETFFVNLTGETNVTVTDNQGLGTIANDDAAPPLSPVNTTNDVDDGSCNASHCSLREAINAANASAGSVSIVFAIPAGDARHFYYVDDNLGSPGTPNGTVTLANIMQTSSADDTPGTGIPDIDPDWPHSWWSILPTAALPALNLTSPTAVGATIDGYSQTGATPDTAAAGHNAVLRIEINGSAIPGGVTYGLEIDNGSNTATGLIINRFLGTGGPGTGNGVGMTDSSDALRGNFIGTDPSGTIDDASVGNAGSGVVVTVSNVNIGGANVGDANLISGNDGHGIAITGNSVVVQGNYIGTKANGTSALPNTLNGVALNGGGAVFDTIGGTGTGEANLIGFNGQDGVSVGGGFSNIIRGNSIFSNGTTSSHLGIDLGTDGVTINDDDDPDTGANNLQNFPVVRTALAGTPNRIRGTLNSVETKTYTIDLYANTACDTSGNGEGKTYLGSTTADTGANGDALWSFSPTVLNAGEFITATATDSSGNTSEFSACFQATGFNAGTAQFVSAPYTDSETNADHTVTITVSRTGGSNLAMDVTYQTTDGTATAGEDYDTASGILHWNNNETGDKTFTITVKGDTIFEGDETVNITLSGATISGTNPTTLTITNSDPQPTLSISDVTLAEGNGATTSFTFTVTKTNDGPVTVNYQTQDGLAQDDNPATEDNDYVPASGSLTFGALEPTKTFTVPVNGDTAPELIETFSVLLSGEVGATLTDGTGLGTILNDDESASAGQLLISEFRLSGPGANATERANNEFIELYNNTDQDVFVTTTDGSAGWAVATSNGVEVFHIPNGITIPARGHFLGTNTNGYSLKDYGGTDASLGNATWTTDVPDNSALAVFRTNNPANFSVPGNRLDSVGPNTETNTLYREGTGYAPLAPADLAQNLEHTFFRQICVFQAGCPTPGRPRDTQDNAADFIFANTIGAATSAGQRLGSPGPENLTSPIKRDPAVNLLFLDATVSDGSVPNRARNSTSDSANASLFGTMTIRRRVVNQTGGTVTRLRFRVIDMTTHPSGTFADLRLRSSSNEVISSINDANTCASTGTPTTPSCTVNVTGLTLEQPPNVPAANGGGLNTTVTLPLPGGLPNGQSINVNFLLGVQKTGQFRFYLVIEALP